MFSKINLAYKVLSNPENRKKYNDSLAKTYDQLKSEDRDVSYHVNEEFLIERDAKKEFDLTKFLNTFENNRSTDLNLRQINIPINNPTQQTLEELMAERDRETQIFQSTLKTELPDPKKNTDDFNYIFRKLYETRTDIEEKSTDLEDFATFNQNDDINPLETNRFINDLSRSIVKTKTSNTTEYSKISAAELEDKMRAYRQEGDLIDETLRTIGNYKIEIDDSQRVVLTEDLMK